MAILQVTLFIAQTVDEFSAIREWRDLRRIAQQFG
jgi:hypothetical protein